MNLDFSVGGYLPTSFLDWDGHVSAVIFTSGCNFRCPWCHNKDLVLKNTTPIPLVDVISNIKARSTFLDGVVISGGEPCMWDVLLPCLRELNALRLPVKLDTNGSFPNVLDIVLSSGLVSHVAMDIKAPFDDTALKRVTGTSVSAVVIKESVDLIRRFALSYEFRTTYSPNILALDELLLIQEGLSYDKHWVLQCFKPVNCLDEAYLSYPAVSCDKLKEVFPDVNIRG